MKPPSLDRSVPMQATEPDSRTSHEGTGAQDDASTIKPRSEDCGPLAHLPARSKSASDRHDADGRRTRTMLPTQLRTSRSLPNLGDFELDLENPQALHRPSPASAEGASTARLGDSRTSLVTAPTPCDDQLAQHGLTTSLARLAKRFYQMSDARTLLSAADDRRFIAQLRAPTVVNADADEGAAERDEARLDRLTAHIASLKTQMAQAGLPQDLRACFDTRLAEIDDALKALQMDKPLVNRAAQVVALNALLAPLPLIIPVMTRPRQQKTEAEIAALMAKAMIEGIGMIRTPTLDRNLLTDRAMARYYANTIQALEFALPTFVGSLRFLNENTAFNVVAGFVSTGALFGGFLSTEIRERFNRWSKGTAHPHLREAGRALSPETKAALSQVKQALDEDQQTLQQAKTDFVAGGHNELSPHVSKQVALAVAAYQRVADELSDCIGLPPAATPTENRDRTAKLALALFATGVCVATTVLMLPDTIGTVDLASDAAFTSALMFSLMADRNVSRKDALEEFKTFVGLSLVMLAVLAANKAAHNFLEHGISGLLVGSITMSALNLTLPGPIGHAAASGIEKLMTMKPSDLVATLRDIGHRAFAMFGGASGTQPRHNVVIQALDRDVEGGLPA